MISIEKELFGKYGIHEIHKYKIRNDSSFQVNVLNYGGIITEIYAKDREGNLKNTVLGYKDFEKYIENNAYPGMIIGRSAGRIENARFEIDGITYMLDKNCGGDSLHGGREGFSTRIFNVEILETGIELSYRSSHMEGGYPGNLQVKVRYTVTEGNALIIEYEGDSDRKTYINMTNHSYFNLSGNLWVNGDEQILTVKSDYVCELAEGLIPTGKFLDVSEKENDIFDFRKGRRIREGIRKGQKSKNYQFKITRAYDHPFKLKWKGIREEPQISLQSLYSGIELNIYTTESTAVIYTGNFLDDVVRFDSYNERRGNMETEKRNTRYLGVAIETQDYPNGVNEKNFESKILEKGENYYSKTIFLFSNC